MIDDTSYLIGLFIGLLFGFILGVVVRTIACIRLINSLRIAVGARDCVIIENELDIQKLIIKLRSKE